MADEPTQKIGQGHLSAFIRQGGKELSQALVALPTSNIRPVEEPGLVGNLTPQEVVQDKGAQPSYQSMLNGYTAQARAEPQRELAAER